MINPDTDFRSLLQSIEVRIPTVMELPSRMRVRSSLAYTRCGQAQKGKDETKTDSNKPWLTVRRRLTLTLAINSPCYRRISST